MLKKLFKRLLLIVTLLTSSTACADVLQLQFKDYIIGGHRTLDLHQALFEQHQVDIDKIQIEKIDVVIKSRSGGGQIWLGSGYSKTDVRIVPGQAANFNNPADWTFSHVVFLFNGAVSKPQLNLNGQFKLREIVVYTADYADSDNTVTNTSDNISIGLPMFHLNLIGLNSINLKQLLASDAGLNLDEYDIQSIEVLAKSRDGSAKVWLESGFETSEKQTVEGLAQVFDSNEPDTYGSSYLTVRKINNHSVPWLLKFDGEIKLHEIIVKLVPR
jgi:hypothetical protein